MADLRAGLHGAGACGQRRVEPQRGGWATSPASSSLLRFADVFNPVDLLGG
ncbi:hypothetical protein M2317_000316 [Microbacterium sp. ZKA21]|uniref:hypothetical protein n=1 Tax=Microbacterium sp. ZKA21 TaxID=3381694 RepID=UPI003D1CC73E